METASTCIWINCSSISNTILQLLRFQSLGISKRMTVSKLILSLRKNSRERLLARRKRRRKRKRRRRKMTTMKLRNHLQCPSMKRTSCSSNWWAKNLTSRKSRLYKILLPLILILGKLLESSKRMIEEDKGDKESVSFSSSFRPRSSKLKSFVSLEKVNFRTKLTRIRKTTPQLSFSNAFVVSLLGSKLRVSALKKCNS